MLDAFDLRTIVAMIGAAIAHTGAAVCFKLAAQAKGRRIFLLFATGNLIGLGHMLCRAEALKGNDPKIVIAVISAFIGVVFVITMNRVFKEKLSLYQWLGIVVVMAGTLWLVLIDSELPNQRLPKPSVAELREIDP